MIRTIIVDDELLAGVGIQSLIDGQEDIIVSGVFNMPEDAVEFLKENNVDIVITDIEMADMDGLELIQIIRSGKLANGIIILSCHDNFSYAQEAISKGTDSYLLKHNVSRKLLVDEIKKVYKKTSGFGMPKAQDSCRKMQKKMLTGQEIYTVGVLRFHTLEYLPEESGQAVDRIMLMHLLEKIVSHYDMGTFFMPYDREIFIIFQFHQHLPKEKRQELLHSNLDVIAKNITQYINGSITEGISTEFKNLGEMREKYEEAFAASEMRFYDPSKISFAYHKPSKYEMKDFSRDRFLEEDGLEILAKELKDCIRQAYFCHTAVWNLTGQLVQAMGRMVDAVLKEYRLGDLLEQKWNSYNLLISSAVRVNNAQRLQEQLLDIMKKFREECLLDLGRDELAAVLGYIDEKLSEKLSLKELAEISCMSIPSFSRKFKERTGKTLVQYLNEHRIERAKALLENKALSLEQVAEEAGFSNANYLIRVFKKITGQTIGEYRK